MPSREEHGRCVGPCNTSTASTSPGSGDYNNVARLTKRGVHKPLNSFPERPRLKLPDWTRNGTCGTDSDCLATDKHKLHQDTYKYSLAHGAVKLPECTGLWRLQKSKFLPNQEQLGSVARRLPVAT